MKAFIFTLLSICTLCSFAQTGNRHSLEADFNYLVPMNEGKTNNFNYSASLMYSEKIFSRIKVSVGVDYSSLSYYTTNEEHFGTRYLKKYQYEKEYLNFPLIVTFVRDSEKKFRIEPLVGLIARKAIRNGYNSYNADIPTYHTADELSDHVLLAFRVGINVAHPINQHLFLNFAPTIDINQNEKNYARYGSDAPDPSLPAAILGFKLGLEYGW